MLFCSTLVWLLFRRRDLDSGSKEDCYQESILRKYQGFKGEYLSEDLKKKSWDFADYEKVLLELENSFPKIQFKKLLLLQNLIKTL